jgi:branched-chain amino acid transport system substrate-binding protein
VVAVVGPGGSREALQVAPIYGDAGLPQILPVATSALLPSAGPWTFRLAPGDSAQGEFIGDFVGRALKGKAATLFYLPDEYGRGLAAGTVAALSRYGVRLIDQVPVAAAMSCESTRERNPYEDVVHSSLRRGRPDVIVVAARQMETLCIARAAGPALPGIRIVAGDGAAIPLGMRPLGGAAADSIYLVAFWSDQRNDPRSHAFVERFRRRTGRDPTHGDAMWFDALMLAAEAIRTVGPDRRAVRLYLESLGRERPPYQGVTGPIGFGLAIRRPLIMTRLSAQGPVPVTP